MEQFGFDDVKAASDIPLTPPGTIGLFAISKVEFIKSKEKETTGMAHTYTCKKVRAQDGTLKDEISSFRHTYWMSSAALGRVQYLAKVMFDAEFKGQLTETQLIAAFQDKDIALKVVGQVNEEKGKGYPDLTYAGFAKKASEFVASPAILQFTTTEQGLIDDALEAMRSSRPSGADKEGAPALSSSGKAF